nr:hypothetical protein [Gordonia rhizosphera]
MELGVVEDQLDAGPRGCHVGDDALGVAGLSDVVRDPGEDIDPWRVRGDADRRLDVRGWQRDGRVSVDRERPARKLFQFVAHERAQAVGSEFGGADDRRPGRPRPAEARKKRRMRHRPDLPKRRHRDPGDLGFAGSTAVRKRTDRLEASATPIAEARVRIR